MKSSFITETNTRSSDAGQSLFVAILLVDMPAGVTVSISIDKLGFVCKTDGGDDV
jgi:hypothetical protein